MRRWGLTLEVKSLLVHSDGECAVVLVIDSNHSPLDKWSDLEREREKEGEAERESQSEKEAEGRHVTLPLSISTVMPATVPHSTLPLFINYPRSSLAAACPASNPAFSSSTAHTRRAAVWKMVEKMGGEEEVGFGRAKEGKGREGWR